MEEDEINTLEDAASTNSNLPDSLKEEINNYLEANSDNGFDNTNVYWHVLNLSLVINRKNNSNVITIPQKFNRYHHKSLEGRFTEPKDLTEDKELFSEPVVHDKKFAYYKDYNGREKTVKNLSDQEKKKIIEEEIKKNQKDAKAIFLYTQSKRLKRVFSMETKYFTKNEMANGEVYHERRNGKAPCCFSERNPIITTIGHATLLIQFPVQGVTILTDPVFCDLQAILYPRHTEPAWESNQLPMIDIILISHNHRDHLDEDSMKKLAPQQPLVLVPQGDGPFVRGLGFQYVQEHTTWQKSSIQWDENNLDNQIEFISVPANHWSCRGLNDANKSLFLGWVIHSSNSEGSIYFMGDSATLAEKDFMDIYRNPFFPPIKTNLVPGGPNHKRATMENTHASACDGILSHLKNLYLTAATNHPFSVKDADERVYSWSDIHPSPDCWEKLVQLSEENFCRSIFMHHNCFELGTDRFNEAIFVQSDLVEIIKSILDSTENKFSEFIEHSKNEIVDLCTRMNVSLEEKHTNEIIVKMIESVNTPKIGEITQLCFFD